MFDYSRSRYFAILSILCLLIVVDFIVSVHYFVIPFIQNGRSGIRAKIIGNDKDLYLLYVQNKTNGGDHADRILIHHIAQRYFKLFVICIVLYFCTIIFFKWERRMRMQNGVKQ